MCVREKDRVVAVPESKVYVHAGAVTTGHDDWCTRKTFSQSDTVVVMCARPKHTADFKRARPRDTR